MKYSLLNTWENILAHLDRVRESDCEQTQIQLLIELLINLRLIGTDSAFPDMRIQKGNIEDICGDVEQRTRTMLASIRNPSAKFIYYAREVIKKFPVRQNAEEMIERIRSDAEAFEENRPEDDPVRGFAGDLRKEVHRRLSPRIITNYLDPYIELAVHRNPEPMVHAGYVALPYTFSPENEDQQFIDLATDLLMRLKFLWDYEEGDMATVRQHLQNNLDIFERCFLRAEVEGLLSVLNPKSLDGADKELDAFKRLASVKFFLKESYLESRIDLYDLILLDLGLGRLVFLLANDLTNNYFVEVTPRNIRDALEVMRELLAISSIKGLRIQNVELRQNELGELRESSVSDFIRLKRSLEAISSELQQYIQSEIIDEMTASLNQILENYRVPTSRLSQIKTRFFNNFIRRTQIHVLSEFVEKVSAAVDKELERERGERQLYLHYQRLVERASGKTLKGAFTENIEAKGISEYIAVTWHKPKQWLRPFLGGKGNSIIDMAQMGLQVPPAFILSYPLLAAMARLKDTETIGAVIIAHLHELEARTGTLFGREDKPLLLSVRSGALTSMPGIMSTIMNIGLVPRVRAALSKKYGANFVDTLYLRFLENCESALSISQQYHKTKHEDGAHQGAEQSQHGKIAALESSVVAAFGPSFLTDAEEQLFACIKLVYNSRTSKTANLYSKTLASQKAVETAATIQQVVFGNLNEKSLSGVLMTRNPITGEDALFGEFKIKAQGEEVVMGSADTMPIEQIDPAIAKPLLCNKKKLIEFYRQDLDIEFTVEDGVLYLLQARAAKLGSFAQLMADTDFLKRGIITLNKYKEHIESLELAYANISLPRADFRFRQWVPPLATGIPINGGVVSGTLIITEERLKEAEKRRESVVFFAVNTKPTDFNIINLSSAIVTQYPGRTSHAAITAMALNKPCIVGCFDIEIDYTHRRVLFHAAGNIALAEGERITIDGNAGAVYRGVAPISDTFMPVSRIRKAILKAQSAGEAAQIVEGMIFTKMKVLQRESSLRKKSLAEVGGLRDRYVLVRVDANIDLTEKFQSNVADMRIALMLPVIKDLLARGATPIICSHRGDPGTHSMPGLTREQIYETYSLVPIAQKLESLMGRPVKFHHVSIGSSGILISKKDIVPGHINMLENLRYATGEKDNDEAFARSLATLTDGLFINDAFNVCLRRHASIVGVPHFVRASIAGPTVIQELKILEKVLDMNERPFIAVFGGDEIEAQYGAMASMLPRVDTMAIILSNNINTASLNDWNASLEAQTTLLASFRHSYPAKIIIIDPRDSAYLNQIRILANVLETARAILWSGAAGLACKFQDKTNSEQMPDTLPPYIPALHSAMKKASMTVICSESEKHLARFSTEHIHISTGPRAFLEYLERLSLPGITALSTSDTQD
jgi:3-phosphoglycerate kinase/phosphohistidine swiveling domain-containing protein